MKEEIEKLKLMTMKPPIFAKEMVIGLKNDLMFGYQRSDGSYKQFPKEMKKQIKRQMNKIKNEIAINELPNL